MSETTARWEEAIKDKETTKAWEIGNTPRTTLNTTTATTLISPLPIQVIQQTRIKTLIMDKMSKNRDNLTRQFYWSHS